MLTMAWPSPVLRSHERKSQQNRDTEVLWIKLDTLEASIPQRVDDAVANRVNELMPTVMQSSRGLLHQRPTGAAPGDQLGRQQLAQRSAAGGQCTTR